MSTGNEKLKQARLRREAARKGRSAHAQSLVAPPDRSGPGEAPYFQQDPPVDLSATHSLYKPFTITPRSFEGLLRLSPDEVGRCDPARLNLLCATGLAGAENLDIENAIRRLDLWSAWIAQQTQANLHHYQRAPSTYGNSEAYWRVLTLATVLQQHFGIHYNPRLEDSKGWDWKDSRDVLLNGPLGPQRSGSCPSLPVLITVTGRRLGYPLQLVHAPAHVFSRWDGSCETSHRPVERFNIEYHGNGMVSHEDEHYRSWPVRWTPAVLHAERRRAKPLYLRSLEPPEVLASFLAQRCHVLFEHQRYDECRVSALIASRLAPHDPVPTLALQSLPGPRRPVRYDIPETTLQYAHWETP